MKFFKNVIKKSSLKRLFILLCLFLLFFIISAFSYVGAISSELSNNLFRLHVIANSDSEEDQSLKYLVRDNIIGYINGLSRDVTNKDEVVSMILQNISEIEKIAKQTVVDNGYNYNIKVDIGTFSFPTKYYGDIALPAGMYDALKIEIGSALGQNWWCVMFPPLCFVDVTSGIVPESSKEIMKENLLDEEYKLISESSADIQFKFKIVEVLQSISTKLANN